MSRITNVQDHSSNQPQGFVMEGILIGAGAIAGLIIGAIVTFLFGRRGSVPFVPSTDGCLVLADLIDIETANDPVKVLAVSIAASPVAKRIRLPKQAAFVDGFKKLSRDLPTSAHEGWRVLDQVGMLDGISWEVYAEAWATAAKTAPADEAAQKRIITELADRFNAALTAGARATQPTATPAPASTPAPAPAPAPSPAPCTP